MTRRGGPTDGPAPGDGAGPRWVTGGGVVVEVGGPRDSSDLSRGGCRGPDSKVIDAEPRSVAVTATLVALASVAVTVLEPAS